MKKILFTFLSLLFFAGLFAQSDKYWTTSGEMIFSFANIDLGETTESANMRFSAFYNFQGVYNIDPSDKFGFYSGLFVRNIGFIYDGYQYPGSEDKVKKKFRTYNVGVPFGLKFGNMKKFYLYVGYDVAYALTYKEKTFMNEKKTDKFLTWFSDRPNAFQHGVVAGIQFPYGLNIKFKYYLSSFHNEDFTETYDGVEYQPYKGMETHIFYVSLSLTLFKDNEIYLKD